jgi:hypothetical protein
MKRMTIPLRVYVHFQQNFSQILMQDADGNFSPLGQDSLFLNVVYLPEHDVSDEGLRRASQWLDRREMLLQMVPCPDGPPHRAGILFYRERRFDPPPAECFLAATARSHDFSWISDLRRGQPGNFVGGSLNAPELWRIARNPDTDAANRLVFTLTPRRLASGLPQPKFDAISNPILREEAKRNWAALEVDLVQSQHYAAVTNAKNVAEAILADLLPKPAGSTKKRTLDDLLREVKATLERKNSPDSGGERPPDPIVRSLDYHLLSILRELHARGHPERAEKEGGPVSLELAMTAVPNLVHALKSLKMVE